MTDHSPLRVMIVDDSSVIRQALTEALSGVAGINLEGSAPNGRIALRKIGQNPPEVCILDLDMPEMDGIELLERLRAEYPNIRVLIHTARGDLAASRAIKALMMGADDIFLKPELPPSSQEARIKAIRATLVPKLLQFRPEAVPPPQPPTGSPARPWRPQALVIGVSTGGPEALRRLIPELPADYPLPILIVQHMPPGFTQALARRLDQLSALRVVEAQDGDLVVPGTVWIAPGGCHLEVTTMEGGIRTHLSMAPPQGSCRPSVDVLFRSAGKVYGGNLLLLVLTGMGSDGRQGALECRALGARVLAQDEASSVVWGMPKSVIDAGLADAVLGLDDLPRELCRLATRGAW